MVVAVAVAASPSSAPPMSTGRSHPTYKEMIVRALTELREPGGSTRLSIAKYVADRFSGLPASHDALLFAHLRRLESEGVLRTYGCFYELSSTPKQRRGRGRPPKIRSGPTALAPSPGEKRGRGRPRKNAVPMESSSAVHPQPAMNREPGKPPMSATPVSADVPVLGEKRGRGRPRKRHSTSVAAAVPVLGEKRVDQNATPVAAVMLGEKRGRGRPPKIKNAPVLTATLVENLDGMHRPGRPRESVVTMGAMQGSSENAVVSTGVAGARRGRGRPPKAKLPPHVGAAAIAMLSLALGKRKRGRPRKAKPLQLGSALSVDAALGKRGPGRPRKEKTGIVGPSETGGVVAAKTTEAGPLEDGAEAEPVQPVGENGADRNGSGTSSLPSGGASSAQKRGLGRPRKKKPSETEPAEIGVAELVEKRPCGRPRKEEPSTASSAETGNGVSMGIKRGCGRPRKQKPSIMGNKETGTAEVECVMVSGENAASAPVEDRDANDSTLGSM